MQIEWIGGRIDIARFDREQTIVTSYYYIGSNTVRLSSPAPDACGSPIRFEEE